MDIRSLNIFIEAAELGSFTRTGEKLGYSQPTISFQIKQLEKEMGAQLRRFYKNIQSPNVHKPSSLCTVFPIFLLHALDLKIKSIYKKHQLDKSLFLLYTLVIPNCKR